MNKYDEAQNEAKIRAGEYALEYFVRDGMRLGLGSGTTSHFFIRALGKKIRNGLNITATATSNSTIELAGKAGIEITDINQIGEIDLTIDGADEIDASYRMIKGGGACLLWEKITAHASKQMIVICDERKLVDRLGAFPLPVEIVPFGWKQSLLLIERLFSHQNIEITLRQLDGKPLITDSGNLLLDCHCQSIADPEGLEIALNRIPGVVENGLFTREADGVCVGRLDGTVDVKMRERV